MFKYPSLVVLGLLIGLSAGEDLWDLGSSQDWLSSGPAYIHPSNYYHPYYGHAPEFVDFYFSDYALPYDTPYFVSSYYMPPSYYVPYGTAHNAPDYMPYWYLDYPETYAGSLVLKSSPRPWWVGSHKDLQKTMDYAKTRSSLRVYRDEAWQPP